MLVFRVTGRIRNVLTVKLTKKKFLALEMFWIPTLQKQYCKATQVEAKIAVLLVALW